LSRAFQLRDPVAVAAPNAYMTDFVVNFFYACCWCDAGNLFWVWASHDFNVGIRNSGGQFCHSVIQQNIKHLFFNSTLTNRH